MRNSFRRQVLRKGLQLFALCLFTFGIGSVVESARLNVSAFKTNGQPGAGTLGVSADRSTFTARESGLQDPALQLLDFHICNPTAACNTSIPVKDGKATLKLDFHSDAAHRRTMSHYRTGGTESLLRSTAWIPISGSFNPLDQAALYHGSIEVTYRIGDITRPTERRLFLQVKAGASESNILSDTALFSNEQGLYVLEGAELKEMLRFAKDQGFTVMRVVQNETDSSSSTASPTEDDLLRDAGIHTCCATARLMRLTFFSGRNLNSPWKIRTIDIDPTADCPANSFANPKFSFMFGGPVVTFQNGVLGGGGPPTATGSGSTPVACLGCKYPMRKIILEGPGAGPFTDSNKPWKDAFRR